MKKTQWKDAFRNIVKQKGSYLSIIIIAAIGSTVFLGLDYSAKSFRINGSTHYNDLKYHDIELVSTLLLDEQNIDNIRKTEGVAQVEGVIQLSALAGEGDEKKNVVLASETKNVNLPTVVEGHLPTAASECAVDKDLAEDFGWQIGDTVTITTEEGDLAEAQEPDGFIPQLKGDRFTITAIIQHPDRGNTNFPQDPYILLSRSAFEYDEKKGAYLKAEILVDQPEEEDLHRFSKDYEDCVQTVLSRLENNAETAAGQRTQRIRALLQEKLDENQALLSDKETELSNARAELDEGWKALEEGEKELVDGQKELDEAKDQLDQAADQLAEGNQELEAAKAELDEAKAQLDSAAEALKEGEAKLQSGREELEDGWDALEDAKESIRNEMRLAMNDFLGTSDSIEWAGRQSVNVNDRWVTAMTFQITKDYAVNLNESPDTWIGFINDPNVLTDEMLREGYIYQNETEEGFDADVQRALLYEIASLAVDTYGDDYQKLQSSCVAWDAGHIEYYEGLTEYNSQLSAYQEGQAAYNEGEALYQESLTAYDDGFSEYSEKLEQYKQGSTDLEKGRKTLEENRAKLEEGEASYAEGLSAYEDGAARLSSAQEDLDAMAPCRFYIYNARGNASYNQVVEASQDLLNLKKTFALMFVLVGALVIYSTVSKIVDEQRTLVGTTKAMGFFKREIFAKYLFFGASATFFGIILGILAARFLMTGFTLRGYNLYYRFDISESHWFIRPTVMVLGLGVMLAVVAISIACFRLLKDPAIQLMRERVPAGRRKEKKNTGRVRTLYSRLILLNMKTDMKRVLVTVVSVAGCCGLVVTGVTLKFAVTGAAREQYDQIFAYDESVSFDPSVEHAEENMAALLEEAGAAYTGIFKTNILYRVTNNQAAELMVGDVKAIHELYHLLDRETGTPLVENGTAVEDGILIQRRIAEIYDLSEGDAFEITIDGTNVVTVKVAGIFEHYIGNPMVMSASYYEKVFHEPWKINMYLLRLSDKEKNPAASADALESLNERFRQVPGFNRIISAEEARNMVDSSTSVVNALVLLFIFLAIAMAGVVLLNMTNMYILQKKNELTVMRINGFTVKETIHYVIRETVITTFLGILLGIGFGSGLAYRIIRTMEKPFLQLYRGLNFTAWAAGIAMTIGLIVLVNLIVLRPVRNLQLRDIQ